MEAAQDTYKVDIWKALDYLERLEAGLAELYEWFAELFEDDQGAQSLFYHLAVEEKSHLNIVRFEIRLVMRERRAFGGTEIDVSKIKKALDQIDFIQSSPRPPSLEQAIEHTLELESYSCDRHYRNAILHANPALASLVNNMTSADERHQESVNAFARDRGFIRSS